MNHKMKPNRSRVHMYVYEPKMKLKQEQAQSKNKIHMHIYESKKGPKTKIGSICTYMSQGEVKAKNRIHMSHIWINRDTAEKVKPKTMTGKGVN